MKKEIWKIFSVAAFLFVTIFFILPYLVQVSTYFHEKAHQKSLDKYNIENLEDLNKPVELSYTFKGPQYFTAAGKFRIMPQLSGLDTSLVAKDKRQYPIDFSILDMRDSVFEIELPDNFLIKYMPPSITEDTPWLKLIIEYNHKENKIYFRQKIELKKNIVSQQDYPDFKAFFEGLAQKIQQRIILEKR